MRSWLDPVPITAHLQTKTRPLLPLPWLWLRVVFARPTNSPPAAKDAPQHQDATDSLAPILYQLWLETLASAVQMPESELAASLIELPVRPVDAPGEELTAGTDESWLACAADQLLSVARDFAFQG